MLYSNFSPKGIRFSDAVTYIKLTGFGANQAASEPCKTHKKQRQTKAAPWTQRASYHKLHIVKSISHQVVLVLR